MLIQFANGIIDTFLAMAPYLTIGLFFAGILHVFVSTDIVVKHLGSNSIGSVVKAAIFGIPLPLCSCGVLPVAMSLRKGKASNGATISFLISTPQTGIDGIIATWGMLGPVFALFRPFAALVMGIVGGLVANLFSPKQAASASNGERRFECNICYDTSPHSHSLAHKIRRIFTYAYRDFFDDISVNLIIGLVLSGAISFLVPDNFFEKYVGNELLSMLMMIALGIPMYTCVTASIPVAVALMLKGLSPGAAFVFLTVGPATNFSFIMVIAQVMGKKIVTVYLATLAAMSVIMGFALNAVFDIAGKSSLEGLVARHYHHHHIPVWQLVLSGIFLIVLLLSFYRLLAPRVQRLLGVKKTGREASGALVLSVSGMSCKNCARKVTEAVKKVSGVKEVEVDVKKGKVKVAGKVDINEVKKAVIDAGYKVA
ncbi:MAG TPA: SO_0444 family Cu/Zn efflux transporter [Chitinivibrionales bacterium]|nr:SO_0444 family Cu/Zn efflux transporter [Chitinivibrionales bacterium]